MSNTAKTLSERAKIEGNCTVFNEYRNDHPDLYHTYDTHHHLLEVFDDIIDRIIHYVPQKDESSDDASNNEGSIFDEYARIYMNWNKLYDTVRVHMYLRIPFWTIFVHYGKLDYIVCDEFNKRLNEIGFQLYTVPKIDEGTDGVGGPDSMSFTLKLYSK